MNATDNVTPLPQPSVKRVRRSPERCMRMREPNGGPEAHRLLGACAGVCEAMEEILTSRGQSDMGTHNLTVELASAAAILARMARIRT